MKTAILLLVALVAAGCTTVRTYDRHGDPTGSCTVSGLSKRGGSCIGYAGGSR